MKKKQENKMEDIVEMVFRKPPSATKIINKLIDSALLKDTSIKEVVGESIDKLPYHERRALEGLTAEDLNHRITKDIIEHVNMRHAVRGASALLNKCGQGNFSPITGVGTNGRSIIK